MEKQGEWRLLEGEADTMTELQAGDTEASLSRTQPCQHLDFRL